MGFAGKSFAIDNTGWVHLVCVHDNDYIKVFVNGVKVVDATVGQNSNKGSVLYFANPIRYYSSDVHIDELALYNNYLFTDEEAKELYYLSQLETN